MKERISNIKENGSKEIKGANGLQELENIRVKYLGKKGELTLILRGMGGLLAEERPIIRKFSK
jgi:phenylalanyl-tRNA synthetase alpha chain